MIEPRPEVARAAPVVHGGYHADGWASDLLDFSANINPFGAAPQVRAALAGVDWERHPDPGASELRRQLGAHLRLDESAIIAGNGSLELIRNVAAAFVRPGDVCLTIGPTFREYAMACELMGGRVIEHNATADTGFVAAPEALLATMRRLRPRLVFLCNPNNPTGVYWPRDAVEAVLAVCTEGLLVLDEAFVQFTEARWPSEALLAHDNIVIMRSMTKDYALAGLRLGYALAHPAHTAALAKLQAPWSVNALAQAAGIAALTHGEHLLQSMAQLRTATRDLQAALQDAGLRIAPSAVHFFLVEVGDARAFAAGLRARGIVVRDCTSFGLPTHVRIATQRPAANARLIEAVRDLRSAAGG